MSEVNKQQISLELIDGADSNEQHDEDGVWSGQLSEVIVSDDLAGDYLRKIGTIERIDAEREVELAKSIEAGLYAEQLLNQQSEVEEASGFSRAELEEIAQLGRDAKIEFISANTRLVVFVAKKYINRGLELPDLIQAGNLGLMRAVEKFDFRKGFKFSTYAIDWIKQSILRTIPAESTNIRVPVHVHDEMIKLSWAKASLQKENGDPLSIEEIAHRSGISPERVMQLIGYEKTKNTQSIHAQFPDGDREFGDTLSDPNSPIDHMLLKHALGKVMTDNLTFLEQEVVDRHHGLGGGKPQSLKTISDALGIKLNRVQRIYPLAIQRLKAALSEESF